MEREYSGFKLLRISRYKNKNEKIKHYNHLQYKNIPKFDELVKEEFEDRLHVYWSWKRISLIVSLVFLFVSIFFSINHLFFTVNMGISLIFMVIHLYFNRLIERTKKDYNFLKSMIQELYKNGHTEPPNEK